MTEHSLDKKTARTAGGILIALTGLSLLFMSHHPTLGAPGYDTLAEEAVAEAGLNGGVHGALIIVLMGFYVTLTALSDGLGRNRLSVRAAQASITAASALMAGAALVSGFVVPGTAASLLRGDAAADFPTLLRMLGATNQTLAEAGTIAYGAAIFFWSLRLVRMTGFARIAGAIGLLVGAGLVGGIVTSALHLDVAGMTLALGVMGLWFVLAALLMIVGVLSAQEQH